MARKTERIRLGLAAGVGGAVPGITLSHVCLASMSAIGLAVGMIREREAGTVLVGGFDSMTRAPHAVRLRGAAKLGDAPLVDVMVHDGLHCSIAGSGMGLLLDVRDLVRRAGGVENVPGT